MDPKHLIETFGPVGIFAMVFAESGLLFGFFLPGDSLLFTAGVLSAPRAGASIQLSLPVVLIGCFVAAVAGAQAGYVIGRRAGPALFRRPDSRLFRQEHVERAERFFARYGARTVVLARFVPIVRTFATVIAGVGKMDAGLFFVFNVVGGLVWTVAVTLLGYVLGRSISNVDRYILPAVAVIVVASFVPVLVQVLRARRGGNDSDVGTDAHADAGSLRANTPSEG